MIKRKNEKSPLFRVYYSDFHEIKTFTAYTDEDISNTPIYEVLVIVQYDEQHGKKLISGGDFYIWDDEIGWLACDHETRNMYMARGGWRKRYLIGAMVHQSQWVSTMKMARSDPDFPEQTALHLYESKEGFV